MEKIKKFLTKILKERWQGLVLLFFAAFLASLVSSNLSYAKAQEEKSLAENNEASEETQVLGEVSVDSEQETEEIKEVGEEKDKTEVKTDPVPQIDPDTQKYEELKYRLERYCEKSSSENQERCRIYCEKTEESSEKNNDKYDKLWEKYCEKEDEDENDNDEKEDNKNTPDTTISSIINLVVTGEGSNKSYEVNSPSKISVLKLMKLANVEYNTLNDGRLDNIGGLAKEYGNMSWMLYMCKNGECGLAGSGASDCKVEVGDKAEWKFVDWTVIDWTNIKTVSC